MANSTLNSSKLPLSPFMPLQSLLSDGNSQIVPCPLQYSATNLSGSKQSITSSQLFTTIRRQESRSSLRRSVSTGTSNPLLLTKVPSVAKERITSCHQVIEKSRKMRSRCFTSHVLDKKGKLGKPSAGIHRQLKVRIKTEPEDQEQGKVKSLKLKERNFKKVWAAETQYTVGNDLAEFQNRLFKIKTMGLNVDQKKSRVYLKKIIQTRSNVIHLADQGDVVLWKTTRKGNRKEH